MRARLGRYRSCCASLLLALAAMLPAAATARQPASVAAVSARDFARAAAAAAQAMGREPAVARQRAADALAVAEALTDPRVRGGALLDAHLLVVEAAIRSNDHAAADTSLDKVTEILRSTNASPAQQGKRLRLTAMLRYAEGRPGEALTAAHQAYRIFSALGDNRSSAIVLQIMGGLYRQARDFDRSARYYKEAIDIYDDEPVFQLAAYNNLGLLLMDGGRQSEAIAQLSKALPLARAANSPFSETTILVNIAAAQISNGNLLAARHALDAAENSSRRLPPEFAIREMSGIAAIIALRQGRWRDAAKNFDATFAGQDLATTDPDRRIYHAGAVEAYEGAGRKDKALLHLKALKRIDDENTALTTSTKNALMAAQFDFASQELKIAKLRSAELQKARELAEAKAAFSDRIAYIAGFGAITVVILAGIAIHATRKRKAEVEVANASLNVTNAKLEKALKAKSEFLATTSHEIRTPLNGVLGMAQVMLADTTLKRDVRDRIDLISAAGKTMQAIIDDILDIAKIDTGKIEIAKKPFDAKRAISDSARLWTDSARQKGLQFSVDMSGCDGTVIGDEQRIRQVVFNLLSNAVKFTDTGRILGRAWIGKDDPTELHVVVSDTGIGIAKDEQKAIFDAFYQVDGSQTRSHGGTGLGLSIAHQLVTAMGGQIRLTSEPGKGSTFYVTVPVTRVETVAQDDTAGRIARSVVVVSDKPIATAMISRSLTPDIAVVRMTKTIADGLVEVERYRIDNFVLVVDENADPGGLQHLVDVLGAEHSIDLAIVGKTSAANARILLQAKPNLLIDDFRDIGRLKPWIESALRKPQPPQATERGRVVAA
jgi:signal transduction histidine kinase